MAFDYDEKDMNDSTSKKIDLDQYGVWVKKPPRNVEETSKEQSNGTKNESVALKVKLHNGDIKAYKKNVIGFTTIFKTILPNIGAS